MSAAKRMDALGRNRLAPSRMPGGERGFGLGFGFALIFIRN